MTESLVVLFKYSVIWTYSKYTMA